MRRSYYVITALLCACLLTGCFVQRDRAKWDLPEDPVAFEDRDSDEYDMRVLTVGGRDYMPFGTLKNVMNDSAIRECLGYLNGDENTRVYTLEEDAFTNYIMIKNVNGVMEQPDYWRAVDTMGENVATPNYIESLGYEEWATSGIYEDRDDVFISIKIQADDVETITMSYDIDGTPAGEISTSSGMTQGSNHAFSIRVDGKCDRAFLGEDFPFRARFTITDTSGNVHDVDGGLDEDVNLDSNIYLILRGDPQSGYSLKKDYK